MKFETRIRKTSNNLYYPQYRKSYLSGWWKTGWYDLYSQDPIHKDIITRCWASLSQAKEACDELHLTGKLVCTKDVFIYP